MALYPDIDINQDFTYNPAPVIIYSYFITYAPAFYYACIPFIYSDNIPILSRCRGRITRAIIRRKIDDQTAKLFS